MKKLKLKHTLKPKEKNTIKNRDPYI
uniref:Uncharacterized protein n=1 Tax=Anguilla anguilla TaxID=7936 RepID=A0A0E9SKA8_ANGAN